LTEPYSKYFFQFRSFLSSQIFDRAEIELVKERIGLFQNMLQRIKLDSLLYQ